MTCTATTPHHTDASLHRAVKLPVLGRTALAAGSMADKVFGQAPAMIRRKRPNLLPIKDEIGSCDGREHPGPSFPCAR